MACNKCLDKMSKRYQKKLRKLTPEERLGTKGNLLAKLYASHMTGPCEHESSFYSEEVAT